MNYGRMHGINVDRMPLGETIASLFIHAKEQRLMEEEASLFTGEIPRVV
jgi:hypothetical protein